MLLSTDFAVGSQHAGPSHSLFTKCRVRECLKLKNLILVNATNDGWNDRLINGGLFYRHQTVECVCGSIVQDVALGLKMKHTSS